jgi:hypothetical protein
MVDSFILAQLPNPTNDPIVYEAISSFMVHGPCGPKVTYFPCMTDRKCLKFYPKKFCEHTTILENGFAQYVQPNNGLVVNKNGIDVDNRFIVPHNVDLVVNYQAHINVERVNRDGMHKYLFKYVTKGFDCARIGIQRNPSTSNSSDDIVNEINNFLKCHCVTPNDGSWRLLQFDIHYTDPSVERLPAYLPFENNVIFTEDDDLEEVLENSNNVRTKLTSWLEINSSAIFARSYTYIEFSEHFTWHEDGKYWATRHKRHNKISRIAHVSPTQGETYYLRMLLHIVRGPTSFSEIRTVGGHEYPTFRLACQSLGLIGDDQEWSHAMHDASQWATPYQLKQLFVTILLFCEVAGPLKLFTNHSSHMSEDITYRINWISTSSNNSSMENCHFFSPI